MLTTAYKPTLSCAHCVVSGYAYVYNNSATDTDNTYFKNLDAGTSTNPGFCCRKVGAAFICEEDYKIFNFLAGHASITDANVIEVRNIFARIAASSAKGGEARRDTLLSALYAEIGKNITSDAAAILLKWKQTWSSAVMYDMIGNGIATEAKLNILLSYMNAVKAASASNYTNQIEPALFQLITTTTNSNLRAFIEVLSYTAVIWAKDATNAAAIIALLTDAYTSDANTTGAVAAVKVHRDKLVAFATSTTYSASSDAVSTAVLEAKRGAWLIQKWGLTDYNAAIAAFTAIGNLTRTVEKGYGTALRSTFDNYHTSTYSATDKTNAQQKLYWYQKQTYSQMFNRIQTLQGTIITTDSTFTAGTKTKLDLILADMQAKSLGVEITGLMVLYAFANLADAGDTKVTKTKITSLVGNYVLYLQQAALSTSSTAYQSGNYSSASFLILKYLATKGADKTATDLQVDDLSSVFFWAAHLSLNATTAQAYTTELSTWKTQSGGSYVYVRDAMMLVNMKNQGTVVSSSLGTTKTDIDHYLGFVAGNSISATATPSDSTAVTSTADVMISNKFTKWFWAYYGNANVTSTTFPTMWADTATVKDLQTQLAGSGVTQDLAKLWCHQLVFLEIAHDTKSAYLSDFSSSTLTSYIVAGASAYTAGGTASQLVSGDMTTATTTTAITNIFNSSNAANAAYWYRAYISDLNTYASAGLTVDVATSVIVQAPEPVVVEAPEPVVSEPIPADFMAKAATGPVVGAAFGNPDPSASGFFKSSDYKSKWLGLAACPTKKDVCGTRDITASTTASTITIGSTAAMTNMDQCTYIITDKTGVPQVKLKQVSSGSISKYKIAYLEYDDKWTDLKMDTTVKTTPDKATVFNWVDNAFAFTEGTLGSFKLKNGTKFRFLTANYVEELIKDWKASKAAYDAKVATYSKAVTAWDTAAAAITTEIAGLVAATTTIATATWTTLPVFPVAPKAPPAYAGVHETSTDLTKFSGNGAPTAGEITLDLDYGTMKYFGAFGQGSTDGAFGYSSAAKGSKYIILSVYPSSAATWTQSNGTNGTQKLILEAKSTTAVVKDLADPGAITAPKAPAQVDPWKKANEAKIAKYLSGA